MTLNVRSISAKSNMLVLFVCLFFVFLPPELCHGWYLHQREISCERDSGSAHALLFPFTSVVFLLGQFVADSDLFLSLMLFFLLPQPSSPPATFWIKGRLTQTLPFKIQSIKAKCDLIHWTWKLDKWVIEMLEMSLCAIAGAATGGWRDLDWPFHKGQKRLRNTKLFIDRRHQEGLRSWKI